MKLPFVDYELFLTLYKDEEPGETKSKVIKTMSRSSTIISNFVGKTLSIHNGKTTDMITVIPSMVGHKIGSFVLTKKLGNSIHNSDHNRKVKEKARRKITQKKVRKTTTGAKATKKAAPKKK